MVTKLNEPSLSAVAGLILAKIHMVTKHQPLDADEQYCLILAKIHMVTKHV